jgi:hypothetical protein
VAVPGWAARNDAPVTPTISINRPLARGVSTVSLLEWMADHPFVAVPLRYT